MGDDSGELASCRLRHCWKQHGCCEHCHARSSSGCTHREDSSDSNESDRRSEMVVRRPSLAREQWQWQRRHERTNWRIHKRRLRKASGAVRSERSSHDHDQHSTIRPRRTARISRLGLRAQLDQGDGRLRASWLRRLRQLGPWAQLDQGDGRLRPRAQLDQGDGRLDGSWRTVQVTGESG